MAFLCYRAPVWNVFLDTGCGGLSGDIGVSEGAMDLWSLESFRRMRLGRLEMARATESVFREATTIRTLFAEFIFSGCENNRGAF